MMTKQSGKPGSDKKPQNQTDEAHGTIDSVQRHERDMTDVSRGSEGERRRASTGQR